MGWLYHFLDLSTEQRQQRRQSLDHHGNIAQVSILVPLLLLQCHFFFAVWLHTRWRNQNDLEVPSSPRVKGERSFRKTTSAKRITAIWRRLQWWCGGPCSILGAHLGTNGELVVAGLWTGWLTLLCLLQTGHDYLHVTKRFGIIASSQLPLHYLLALKSPFSPLQLLTRCSYETLNNSHQLLGRIITLLLYLHAAFYLNFYVLLGLLGTKLKETYVLCGIFGILAFTAVGTTALSPLRKWSYRVFYITHVSLATAILPVLFFHVSHVRVYLYETAAIYALNVALRALTSHSLPGKLKLVPGTNLLEIEVPLHHRHQHALRRRWQAGQHAYVSLSGHPLLRTFKSNPFTVASLPGVDDRLRFVARVLDGNTAKLAHAAGSDDAKTNGLLTIEGPYGVGTHAEALLRYDRVVFVAGGVGATFIVPLYRQLLADLSPSPGSYRRQKVSFLWIVRSEAEVSWAIPVDEKGREGFVERLSVYVTGGGHLSRKPANGRSTGTRMAANDHEVEDEGIELEEHKGLLSSSEASLEGVSTSTGRPNLAHLVDQAFAHRGDNNAEKVAFVVCGPQGLSRALRREVGRWVARGREVWFWDESFAN
ncbi:hypothetical protein LTR91_001332 [Friedmanniomyces endolithicus]|uniref:ferric-chelate reductase (NADPH) n=1 Tax=Friedmanniomyces endolithicus TaxID=329885 RepID=A0AAN6L2T0_9PEZI|nr:hypothetical protein LTR35_008098 [Friedmanniomyces endolithicus]KAK0282192.1 hypothetical protein LTS00_012307 [Friedmanniomyces endolithicus]KAK0929817.1 hypothetical protein LTR57_001674 [Friedmanniomyces endolithicus]KAK1012990.1 hypothetical protein LTS01_000802 [Friedmanniomyces endolithicus]KAK1013735.1 hypothetical protein LTR91_001332 [Friedmanniomyces endolithicus]